MPKVVSHSLFTIIHIHDAVYRSYVPNSSHATVKYLCWIYETLEKSFQIIEIFYPINVMAYITIQRIEITNTYEECKGCAHCCLHQATGICHSLYPDQVAREIHTGHLSVSI